MSHETLKWLHVLSATLLVGGGFGSAFHLLVASVRRRPDEAAAAAHGILRFDGIVGGPAFVFQLAGGFGLLPRLGLSPSADWVALSLTLYAAVLVVWIPVIALEFRMRRLAREAESARVRLPGAYWRSLACWMTLGAVGFAMFACVFWLMLFKRVPFS
jgi:uncharacterized membrane protein